jgi:LPXTG-site transpeptidase (sortase) family protein
MSKRLLIITVLVLAVGFFTRAFAFADTVLPTASADQPITRAEAVALLVNANPAGVERTKWFAAHMPLFSDVNQTQWYAPYLETAFEQGWITGNGDLTFRPNGPLKQEEAIAIATHYKEIEDPSAGVYLTITGSQGNWLNKIVSEAQANAIKMPFPVRPGESILRQDFYSMVASAGVDQPDTIQVAVIPVTTDFHTTAQPLQPIIQQAVAANTTTNEPDPVVPAEATNSYFAISMPTLGIKDLHISHPTDLTHDGLLVPLKSGVGHLFSYPGQDGKILIYGHSSSYPWDVSEYTKIFRKINQLAIGDMVYINYHGTLYTYKVTFKQTVPQGDTSAFAQEGKEELILYTCWPPDSIKQRYLVHADLVSAVVEK